MPISEDGLKKPPKGETVKVPHTKSREDLESLTKGELIEEVLTLQAIRE